MTEVSLRCTRNPKRLFARMKLEGLRPAYYDATPEGRNLIEFKCRDCEKLERRADPSVTEVFHRFNIIGEFEETEYVFAGGRSEIRDEHGMVRSRG